MNFKDVMNNVSDAHKLMTSDPLVIEFSNGVALNVFLRQLEEEIGMRAGELNMSARINGYPCAMYDGIEFRVKARAPQKAGVDFWAEAA